jgi:hypothetical protein
MIYIELAYEACPKLGNTVNHFYCRVDLKKREKSGLGIYFFFFKAKPILMSESDKISDSS